MTSPRSWPGMSTSAVARVRTVATSAGVETSVLTSPGAVAWVTGGLNVPVDRTAPIDTVWVVVRPDRVAIISTDVEAPRVRADYLTYVDAPELLTVPWWEPGAFVEAVEAWSGERSSDIASDSHPAFGRDLEVELTQARLALDDVQSQSLRELGRDATHAVESALRTWRPGHRDHDIAAMVAAEVERVGALAPVLLVGGDDRLARFRHPVSVGAAMHRRVMAVLVASRGGQHVALTRYAVSAPDSGLDALLRPVQRMHRAVLAASTPGATAGELMTVLDSAYRSEGFPDAWREHYQGGPIGYAQREFEIAPGQTRSRWWSTTLPLGAAVAWNPSIAGGAKDEDTFLVGATAVEPITFSTDWPTVDDQLPARPAPLVVGI